MNKNYDLRLQKMIFANKQAKLNRIKSYESNPSKCFFCNCVLIYEKRKNKFCSSSCSASVTNLGQVKNLKHGFGSKKECLYCKKETNNRKFCSNLCCLKKQKENRYLEFESTGLLNCKPILAKEYLSENRGRKCEICQSTEWFGEKIPLVLDHINGNPNDNRIINLRLVCGNCNMLLPTFAGRNKGKGGGRPHRNLRYKEGKSF